MSVAISALAGDRLVSTTGAFPRFDLVRWPTQAQLDAIRDFEVASGYPQAVIDRNVAKRERVGLFYSDGEAWSISPRAMFPVSTRFPGLLSDPLEFMNRLYPLLTGQYNPLGTISSRASLNNGSFEKIVSPFPTSGSDSMYEEFFQLRRDLEDFMEVYLPGMEWSVYALDSNEDSASDYLPLTSFMRTGNYTADFSLIEGTIAFDLHVAIENEDGTSRRTSGALVHGRPKPGSLPWFQFAGYLINSNDTNDQYGVTPATSSGVMIIDAHMAYLLDLNSAYGEIPGDVFKVDTSLGQVLTDATGGTWSVHDLTPAFSLDPPSKTIDPPWTSSGFMGDSVDLRLGTLLGGLPLASCVQGKGSVVDDRLPTEIAVVTYDSDVLKALADDTSVMEAAASSRAKAYAILSSRRWTVRDNPLSRTSVWARAEGESEAEAQISEMYLIQPTETEPGVTFAQANKKASGVEFSIYWIYETNGRSIDNERITISDQGYFQDDVPVTATDALAAYISGSTIVYTRTDVPIEEWAESVAGREVTPGAFVPSEDMIDFQEGRVVYEGAFDRASWSATRAASLDLLQFAASRKQLNELLASDIAMGRNLGQSHPITFEV